jgi:SM-20-related protein
VPDPEFLARFGIFSVRDFLDAAACAELRAEMRRASERPATVSVREEEVDEGYRRTKMAQVSEATRDAVTDRLIGVMPRLEEHFGVSLTALQRPQFLVYREGDFFRRHTDNAEGPDASEPVRARRISTVLFLGGQDGAGGNGHEGGELTFYGLLGEGARRDALGLPLTAAPGLLVAFPSELVHSVTPITRGERFTIVSWFS